MIEKRVPTAEKVNSLVKIVKVYSGTTEKSGVILWTGSATTIKKVATVYLTDNGLKTGNAIFANVFSIQAGAEESIVHKKTLSFDRKTLAICVRTSDETKVDVLVIGD